MDGLGVSALTLAYILFPGLAGAQLVARKSDGFADDRSYLSATFTRRAFVFGSCVILSHGFAFIAIECLHDDLAWFRQIDFQYVAALILPSSNDQLIHDALVSLDKNILSVFGYTFLAAFISIFFGWLLSKIPANSKSWFDQAIEQQLTLLGIKKDWNKLLVHVTASIDYCHETQLIRGIYSSVVSDEGKDIALVLLQAKRRNITDDQNERYQWQMIPGEMFFVRFDQIHTFNVNLMWFFDEETKKSIERHSYAATVPDTAVESGETQNKPSKAQE